MTPFLNFLKYLIPFSAALFLGQKFIVTTLFENIPFFYSTWSIYVFHILVTGLSYVFLLFVHQNFPEKTGFTFMGMGLIKMMAAVVFLIPMIQSDIVDRIPDVAQFFIPYFLFLSLETVFAIRLINKEK